MKLIRMCVICIDMYVSSFFLFLMYDCVVLIFQQVRKPTKKDIKCCNVIFHVCSISAVHVSGSSLFTFALC